MNLVDPIQVWENNAPTTDAQGNTHCYKFVAYRDAADCAGYYGYGNTIAEATLDFLRQEADTICCNCTDPCSQAFCSDDSHANECILVEPNLSAWINRNMPEDDTTHREWREINGPKPY